MLFTVACHAQQYRFTHESIYAQKIYTQTIYTQTLLYSKLLYTHKLLHAKTFKHKCC